LVAVHLNQPATNCKHPDPGNLKKTIMTPALQRQLISYLREFATQSRIDTFERVLANRTRYITVALENIFQSHNASAVLRTMECFGIQDIHIIENDYEYQVNPDIALGSSKWLSLTRYNEQANNTADAIAQLRRSGYRIVATSPHADGTFLEDFDLSTGRAAFFFGTEMEGLSDIVLEQADEFVQIPIYGFTESFNISVSVAITLHHLSRALRRTGVPWELTESENDVLRFEWLKTSVKHSDLLINRYLTESAASLNS